MKVFNSSSRWLIFLFVASLFCFKMLAQMQVAPDYTRSTIEDKIDNKVCRAAKKYGDLSLSGQGGLTDIMLEKVRDKTYYFSTKEGLTLEKGREYLVKLTLDILKIYNEEKLYRKHLFEYPFSTKNLDLAIFSQTRKAKDLNLPNIKKINFHLNHLSFIYLTKISGKPQGLVDFEEPDYEQKKIKEGFRIALNKVKHLLSPDQLATAENLNLLDGSLVDDKICADQEYRKEIDTKELWILYHEKKFREGRIDKERLCQALDYQKMSRLNKWEKDITFSDEKAKALYQKKIEYLKGEKEWEN